MGAKGLPPEAPPLVAKGFVAAAALALAAKGLGAPLLGAPNPPEGAPNPPEEAPKPEEEEEPKGFDAAAPPNPPLGFPPPTPNEEEPLEAALLGAKGFSAALGANGFESVALVAKGFGAAPPDAPKPPPGAPNDGVPDEAAAPPPWPKLNPPEEDDEGPEGATPLLGAKGFAAKGFDAAAAGEEAAAPNPPLAPKPNPAPLAVGAAAAAAAALTAKGFVAAGFKPLEGVMPLVGAKGLPLLAAVLAGANGLLLTADAAPAEAAVAKGLLTAPNEGLAAGVGVETEEGVEVAGAPEPMPNLKV